MSAPHAPEIKLLLQHLKEVHAPDRCDGWGNDAWHGVQRFKNFVTGSTKTTEQQQLTASWNIMNEDARRTYLKKLTNIPGTQHDFYEVCYKVDGARIDKIRQATKTSADAWATPSSPPKIDVQLIKQKDLNEFITDITPEKLQLLFDKLIVDYSWRRRMWNIQPVTKQ